MAHMKIGELAQRTGLAASRIRFYERIGLLGVAQRQANDLGELIAQIEARPEDMDCAGNARRVLSQMRLLGPDEEATGRPAQPSN